MNHSRLLPSLLFLLVCDHQWKYARWELLQGYAQNAPREDEKHLTQFKAWVGAGRLFRRVKNLTWILNRKVRISKAEVGCQSYRARAFLGKKNRRLRSPGTWGNKQSLTNWQKFRMAGNQNGKSRACYDHTLQVACNSFTVQIAIGNDLNSVIHSTNINQGPLGWTIHSFCWGKSWSCPCFHGA